MQTSNTIFIRWTARPRIISAHPVRKKCYFNCAASNRWYKVERYLSTKAILGTEESGGRFRAVAVVERFKRGCVTAAQLLLFNFANYSPSIAMKLKVRKDITCKWQNQRSETNKYVSWALFLNLQAAGINFEKLLGWTVFKNHNFNPFQSFSVLTIRGICCFCYVILTFL